jgi:1-acyl-sn-glycerol-3-phosphate acyltransferase
MTWQVSTINWVLRRFFGSICRIDKKDLNKVPARGPLIIVANHINFLEAPIVISHLDPRPVTGLAKKESWDSPWMGFLFNQWGIISIDREQVDREAFRLAGEALTQEKILAVAPEGTRSGNGCMQQGKPGVVALAVRSKATLLPVGFSGHENFWYNIKHLRRTDFRIRVGKPFRIDTGGEGLSRDARQAIADEIMCKIAELLPADHWGYYQNVGRVPYKYLVEV